MVLGWLKSRVVRAVWMGTPCASWSRARHGPPGTSWCSIRSADFPLGIQGLSGNSLQAVRSGNAQMTFTVRVIRLCRRLSIPVYVENPGASFLWSAPPMASL
eukprot:5607654-Pyramimonas_sp.AAC.1